MSDVSVRGGRVGHKNAFRHVIHKLTTPPFSLISTSNYIPDHSSTVTFKTTPNV